MHRQPGRDSLTSRLLQLCNGFHAHGDGWTIPIGRERWRVDGWRPVAHAASALTIELAIGEDRFLIRVDQDLDRAWFDGVVWSRLSPPVRVAFLTYCAAPLLAWLEKTLAQPIRVTTLTVAGEQASPMTSPMSSPVSSPEASPMMSVDAGPDRGAAHQLGWRIRRLADDLHNDAARVPASRSSDPDGIGSQPMPSGRLALQVQDAAALARLAPLVAAMQAATRGQAAGAGPSALARGSAAGSDGVFYFDLVLARVTLTALDVVALMPGDLLMPPALRGRTRSATEGLPLTLSLGRTPLRHAALEARGIRFGAPVSGGATEPAPVGGPESSPPSGPPPRRDGDPGPDAASPFDPDPAPSSALPLSGALYPVTADPQSLQLDVTLRFGQMRMTLAQLAATRPGQFIETSATGEEPEVDLLVDGRPVGRGKLVRLGQDWGVSIVSWQVGGDGK